MQMMDAQFCICGGCREQNIAMMANDFLLSAFSEAIFLTIFCIY